MSEPERRTVLRLATYNIHRAIGTDRHRDPRRIARVINELDADVIGLQEVDWQRDWDETESPLEMLTHLPGYVAVPGPNLRDHRGHYGNLLLTRLDLAEVRRIDLSERGREPRGAIDAELDVPAWPGAPLRVMVTHFGLAPGERARQAARLGAALAEQPGQPTVLLGDFNEWIPGSPTLRPLLRHAEPIRWPASFPSRLPLFALDRVLACWLGAPFARWRHDSALARVASDHLPVVIEIGTDGAAGEGRAGARPRPTPALPRTRRGARAPSATDRSDRLGQEISTPNWAAASRSASQTARPKLLGTSSS